MIRKSKRKLLTVATRGWLAGTMGMAAALALAAGLAGCRVHVEKGANGEEKHVQVDTPFGGIHVNTDQITAADLGLPVYPGAQIVRDNDKNKSADVHMGFGEWQMRVKAVNYSTADSQDKVAAFYKQALGRYGDVITCQGNAPVGTPAVTSEGLSCEEGKGGGHVRVDAGDFHSDAGNYQLKAGSKRHQHIVGFQSPVSGQTRFALVTLDLPEVVEGGSGKSD
jgi:hypothetical protein